MFSCVYMQVHQTMLRVPGDGSFDQVNDVQ